MTDAEFAAQQSRLRVLSDRWLKPLGLGWWKIDVAYAREEYRPPDHAGTSKDDSVAHCHVDWRYVEACITWNMPKLPELNDDELEMAFCHECAHILLHEMRWTADNSADSLDHEERVASTLAKAFLWLRDELTEKPDDPYDG